MTSVMGLPDASVMADDAILRKVVASLTARLASCLMLLISKSSNVVLLSGVMVTSVKRYLVVGVRLFRS